LRLPVNISGSQPFDLRAKVSDEVFREFVGVDSIDAARKTDWLASSTEKLPVLYSLAAFRLFISTEYSHPIKS